MPTLANATIQFHTNDEDKDNNTKVRVTVKDQNNVVCAEIENQFKHFDDNSDSDVFGVPVKNPSERDDCQRGTATIHITPVGNDTWRFHFALDLLFSDGSHLSGTSGDIELSQDSREQTFGLSGIIKVTP